MCSSQRFLPVSRLLAACAFLLVGCAQIEALPPTRAATPGSIPSETSAPPPSQQPTSTSTDRDLPTDQPAGDNNLADLPLLEPANLEGLELLGTRELDPGGEKLEFQLYDWSEDGSHLVACVNQQGASSYQVFNLDDSSRQAEIKIDQDICRKASNDDRWHRFNQDGSTFLGGLTQDCLYPVLAGGVSCDPTIFDSRTGDQISILGEPPAEFPGEVAVLQAAAFSPAGDTLAAVVEYPSRPASTEDAAVEGGEWTAYQFGVELFEVETGEYQETLQKMKDWDILDLAYSPGGKLILVSSFEAVEAWQISNGKVNQVPCPQAGITFSPSGETAALACDPNGEEPYQMLWNPRSGEVTYLSGAPEIEFRKLRFSADGKLVMGLSSTKRVSIWDGESGGYLSTLPETDERALDAHFIAGGRMIAVLDSTGRLQLFGVK